MSNGNRSGTVSHGLNWVFGGGSAPTATDLANLATNGTNFYDHIPSGGVAAPSTYLSPSLSGVTNASTFDIFAVDPLSTDPGKLGPPISSTPFTLSKGSGGRIGVPYANEIATCLSYRSDYGTDEEFGTHVRPRADDRGRMYFGPLNGLVEGSTGIGLIYFAFAANYLQDLGLAFDHLVTATTNANWLLAVWSRKEKVFKLAIEWAINNHPDVQRKRSSIVPSLQWTAFA